MADIIDGLTGLPAVIKQPNENRIYTFDFSALLGLNTISSVTSVVQDNQNLVSGSTALSLTSITNSDNKVQVRISSGTDKEHYKLTALVLDTGGNTLEGDGMMFVEDL